MNSGALFFQADPSIQSICLSKSSDLQTVLQVMLKHSIEKAGSGFVIVLDENQKLCGVVTDGDVRRALLRGCQLTTPVVEFMNQKPLSVPSTSTPNTALLWLESELKQRRSSVRSQISHLIVVDPAGRPFCLANVYDLNEQVHRDFKHINVYGMGYVGITLAAVLATCGYSVQGLDVDERRVTRLQKNEMDVHEPGLGEMVEQLCNNGLLSFSMEASSETPTDVHVVAVGTPVDSKGIPDLTAIREVCETIGKNLSDGSLVVFRSTVPVGTTRDVCLPILEKHSCLKGGQGFFLAFAPERTVEGDALRELRELPQIIGGLTKSCGEKASMLFSKSSISISNVENLEAAEVIKLINNSFRDLSFAFANEVALMCEGFNLNSLSVIKAANEGYPRNKIPAPSPGVGGYCLTKDPFLMSTVRGKYTTYIPRLGPIGRAINEEAIRIPLRYVEHFCSEIRIEKSKLKIGILGIAFKGEPETTDCRFSPALELAKLLKSSGFSDIALADALVSKSDLAGFGYSALDLNQCAEKCDAIVLMNNHRDHRKVSFPTILSKRQSKVLFFDGWGQFQHEEFSHINNVIYSNLGYNSSRDRSA